MEQLQIISCNVYALPSPIINIEWSHYVPDMGPTHS